MDFPKIFYFGNIKAVKFFCTVNFPSKALHRKEAKFFIVKILIDEMRLRNPNIHQLFAPNILFTLTMSQKP